MTLKSNLPVITVKWTSTTAKLLHSRW